LVGELEGKRAVEKPRHRREDSTKIYLREERLGDVDWIHLAENTEQRQVLRVAYNVEKFLSSRATVSFARRTQLHKVR
jgi:hypothetical protein